MQAGIVDYNVGNVANLGYALERAGYEPVLTRDKKVLLDTSIVILPGVGAAAPALQALQDCDLVEVLNKRVHAGKLLAGICLGMQLLYEYSYEDGKHQALGYLPGDIKRFDTNLKVPHMGWNELVKAEQAKDKNLQQILFTNLPPQPYVYFVHSYLKQPNLTGDVISYADYGQPVPAIVGLNNVVGMQFHPEKSATVGEQILRNLKSCLDVL